MTMLIHSSYEKYTTQPENITSDYTVVTITHAQFDQVTLYLPNEVYLDSFPRISRYAWMSGAVIVIVPII